MLSAALRLNAILVAVICAVQDLLGILMLPMDLLLTDFCIAVWETENARTAHQGCAGKSNLRGCKGLFQIGLIRGSLSLPNSGPVP